jgi:transposase
MKISREQRVKILRLFPIQRGNLKIDNSRFLDAVIYICENGCKGRALPPSFGPRHTIYARFNPWAKNGVPERVFRALREEQITNKRVTVVSLDSRSVKARPDAAGALKKTGSRPRGRAAEG